MKRHLTALALAGLLVLAFLDATAATGTLSTPQYSVYIRAEGSVEGTSSIQRNGNTYTFTGNVLGPIGVEKDDIVIDGAGFTLNVNQARRPTLSLEKRQGVTFKNVVLTVNGQAAIDLTGASNCKIANCTISGIPVGSPPGDSFVGLNANGIGILLREASNCIVQDNQISFCNSGIFLDSSYSNIITGNSIFTCTASIALQNTTDNTLRDNRLINNGQGFSFTVFPFYQYLLNDDLDTSNTINGKPVYYLRNKQDTTVPSNCPCVVLLNCRNILFENGNPELIVLKATNNSTIANATITGEIRDQAIALLETSGINIQNCTIKNRSIGIVMQSASNNKISGCTIGNCSYRGINFESSNNNVVSTSNFTDNGNAIALYPDQPSLGNTFTENKFASNNEALRLCRNNSAVDNSFTGSNVALEVMEGADTLTGNIFTNNTRAMQISGTNSILRNNRMENNTYNLYLVDPTVTNNIDTTNIVNGGPVYVWTNEHDQTVPVDASYVALFSCRNITVQNLTLTNNGQGIVLVGTTNSTVKNNVVASNGIYGIQLYNSAKNAIAENNVTQNYWGMAISSSTNNTIIGNNFTKNNGFALTFVGNQKDNLIHHNNFVGNVVSSGLQVSIDKMSGPGWGNLWDDDKEGNYWSDYQIRYTNASAVPGTNVGNTPFVINENNQDNHPLLTPTYMSGVSIELPQETPSPNNTSTFSPSPMQSSNQIPQEPRTTSGPNPTQLSVGATIAVIIAVVVVVIVAVLVVKIGTKRRQTKHTAGEKGIADLQNQ